MNREKLNGKGSLAPKKGHWVQCPVTGGSPTLGVLHRMKTGGNLDHRGCKSRSFMKGKGGNELFT